MNRMFVHQLARPNLKRPRHRHVLVPFLSPTGPSGHPSPPEQNRLHRPPTPQTALTPLISSVTAFVPSAPRHRATPPNLYRNTTPRKSLRAWAFRPLSTLRPRRHTSTLLFATSGPERHNSLLSNSQEYYTTGRSNPPFFLLRPSQPHFIMNVINKRYFYRSLPTPIFFFHRNSLRLSTSL